MLLVPFKQMLATIVRDAYFDSSSGMGMMRSVKSWDDIFTQGGLKNSRKGQKLIGMLVEQVPDCPQTPLSQPTFSLGHVQL